MDRAERRRKEREAKKGKKTYNLTADDIAKLKAEATVEAVEIGLNLLFGIPLLAMRDLNNWSSGSDWGKKRLNKLHQKMYEIYMDVERGNITLYDINAILEVEVGLEVNNKSARRSLEIYKGV